MQPNPATAVTCLPVLTDAECDAVLERLGGWTDATIQIPGAASAEVGEMRRCSLTKLEDPALLDRLWTFVRAVNDGLFQYELTGFSPDDPVAAMRYGEGGHFAWHIDNATLPYATRKLSFTVQLSDPASYDGGDLELMLYEAQREAIRQRGWITLFPAFHPHRVTAVTRGTRTAIVGWVHGPRFR